VVYTLKTMNKRTGAQAEGVHCSTG